MQSGSAIGEVVRLRHLRNAASHRQTMTNYYNTQTDFSDATRWMFVYGRETLIGHIDIRPGERILDIGCEAGKNFDAIQEHLRSSGKLIGVDCSPTMLEKAEKRIRSRGWKNVQLINVEYNKKPITKNRTNI